MMVASQRLADVLVADTARRRLADLETDIPVHPNLCGPCEDCVWSFAEVDDRASSDEATYWKGFGPSPSLDALRRHRAAYGSAAMEPWGISHVPAKNRSQRRNDLESVRSLLERRPDATPAVVAEVLVLTERKAKYLLTKVRSS